MVRVHPNVVAYLDEFAGNPLVDRLNDTIGRFMSSQRYLPAEGEKSDRGHGRYWWIIDHHSMLVFIKYPDAYILGIVDGEVRGRDGIEYYLNKFTSNL